MKIVFIQPRGRTIYTVCPEPPLGLAYLASSLRKYNNDLEIEIIDGFILDHDEYWKKISDLKADIVGVTTTMSLLNEALKIPNIVKEKNINFIIGGPGVANIPSLKLYECGYSVVSYGEGERTIVDLVKAFENKLALKDIDGISFLSANREIKTSPRKLIENLDEIPFPARDLLDMKKYINTWKDKMGVALSQIVSSRGCQYSCRFCDRAVFGRKIRFFSPTRVVEEMKILYDRYNVEMVYFEEDLFTSNKKRVLNFCDAMEKELPGKKWGAYSRVETIDLEMLNRMKLAGCTDLVFGAENGSQRLLDFLGKGITVEQIKKAFKWVHEVGINGGMFLILGIPGETRKDIDMTKKLIFECEPMMINLYFLTPIPGTEIFEITKHLIRNDVDFYNFDDLYGGVYKKEVFEIDPMESYKEVLNFFLNTFRDRIDPRLSLYDGTVAAEIGVV
jgi:radical SAM superfamily enzyme YgiQ (UPF0313 family)